RVCVDACRSERQDCRDATRLGAGIARCLAEEEANKEECRRRFPIGSRLREVCIDKAEIQGFLCRNHVRRNFAHELRACQQAYKQCTGVCLPGAPPEGIQACKEEGRAALQSAVHRCRLAFQTTAAACFDKDVSCLQSCMDARDVCGAPTQAALAAAIATCLSQEAAALVSCQMANPGGGSALDQCNMNVRASAFTC